MSNPFAGSSSKPGFGKIILSVLPPDKPVLETVSYQYPLKLIAPSPIIVSPRHSRSSGSTLEDKEAGDHSSPDNQQRSYLVHTVYLLTYGGGLVAGDAINLTTTLARSTRLILLTQGSTKIFKSPDPSVISKQFMNATLLPGSALCYLPDPVQPFGKSAFEQTQVYGLVDWRGQNSGGEPSLCVLDWVNQGRSALGEKWDFWRYGSKNEVYLLPNASEERQSEARKKRLLLRDALLLHPSATLPSLFSERMDNLSIFGTLILCGPVFTALGDHFLAEFEALPRIGGRNWDSDAVSAPRTTPLTPEEQAEIRKLKRQKQEKVDGLLWTAARVRNFVLVKFGAKETEGAKRWLSDMIKEEGSVEREFGERATLCLR
ncbi:hypothetical protein K402DRAFT_386755 [Aulographum hederae CBS 113979]|uniref:UreD-domain-containing protein n=1 Tax=Aulographum hederae CBS 113979 TaxID=1176131 RepID=A0A6G1GKL5_9PEZI|nr:hypothetical protein K402DRAFT_386755 [Aulographum hederae CBS 113979]